MNISTGKRTAKVRRTLTKRLVNHARPNDVTQGHAADWTIAQLREPAQRIADRIEALMHPSEAPSSMPEVASTVIPGIGR